MKKAVITGANGFVGSSLVEELLNRDYVEQFLHQTASYEAVWWRNC